MSAQAATVASVARRGYLNGWTDDELVARQVVKLAEELGELASTVETDDPQLAWIMAELQIAGKKARALFDVPGLFVGATVHSAAATYELTDCQVVIDVAAHALGIPDIGYAAQVKAEKDVGRGVRNGQA
ncbi:MAG: hypothetical protein KDI07_21955 [Anaerolineae bacterium]|nr:hypothetical protein [Anaerolineae bacterium]